jgi:prophage DNA circulation protein
MISEVLDHGAELEKQIRQTIENNVEQERTLASENALIVRSVQKELHRKLTEMEALQDSLDDPRMMATRWTSALEK